MHTVGIFNQAIEQLAELVIGKEHQARLAMACLVAKGHLLIEDLPGMGKTTLSHGLAEVLGMAFSRVQFTADLLPADLLGVNIFDSSKQQFTFHAGPVFSQLLLADEINRASPKTQSALLEAMEEGQISIDGVTRKLPEPFFVIATQNPAHHTGTYPLPESQLDRFLMRIQLGYPNWQSEKRMLTHSDQGRRHIDALLSPQGLLELQDKVDCIKASDAIVDYILRLVTLSRESQDVGHALSPRASKAILRSSRAWAMLAGRDFVVPEDVQAIFAAVCEHRLRSSQTDLMSDGHLSQHLLEQVDPLAA